MRRALQLSSILASLAVVGASNLLWQSYLDENHQDGLMVALDWEKAFDSVSWDYMHASFHSAGLGADIRRWLGVLYNHDDPPYRVVQANGTRSAPFPLHSGIPQGDPTSPIVFLFVAEALSRMINIMKTRSIKV